MYQPTWKDGREVAKGKRDGAQRYDAISQYLRDRQGLPNDLRILDFGAQAGYFSQRLAEDFDARVVAIDSNRKALAEAGRDKRIRTRIAHYTPDQLRNLGHFDVVLALSVLHHQPNWQEYLDALTSIGTVVFVEVSHPDEQLPRAVAQGQAARITEAVSELSQNVLVETPGYDEAHLRPLFVIDLHRDHAHAKLDHSVEQGVDASATHPVEPETPEGPIVENPVPEAVVEERMATTQNFEDPGDERTAKTDLEPSEKQDVAAAAAEGEDLKPGPEGNLTPPARKGRKGKGGLSDSQHVSSDQLD